MAKKKAAKKDPIASHLTKEAVLDQLDALRSNGPRRRVFGAEAHQFRLNPPLSSSVLDDFERKHSIQLPGDYRSFLTDVGNGGAGPFYGVFPFGKHDDGFELCSWEKGGLLGDVSKPFKHTAAWNLPDSFWEQAPDPGPEVSLEEEDRLMAEWDKKLESSYWSPSVVDGAIPICHEGCAYRIWLVVHGPERGYVWSDGRVDQKGLYPAEGESGERVSFSDWYWDWLKALPPAKKTKASTKKKKR